MGEHWVAYQPRLESNIFYDIHNITIKLNENCFRGTSKIRLVHAINAAQNDTRNRKHIFD